MYLFSVWQASQQIYLNYPERQIWANDVHPDQMTQDTASDQVLHCLPKYGEFHTLKISFFKPLLLYQSINP